MIVDFLDNAWVVYDETDTLRDHPSGWVSRSGPPSGPVRVGVPISGPAQSPPTYVRGLKSSASASRCASASRNTSRSRALPTVVRMQPKCQHSACSRILGSPGLVLVFGDRVFPSALKPPRWQREQRSLQADCHQADDQTQSPTGESECPYRNPDSGKAEQHSNSAHCSTCRRDVPPNEEALPEVCLSRSCGSPQSKSQLTIVMPNIVPPNATVTTAYAFDTTGSAISTLLQCGMTTHVSGGDRDAAQVARVGVPSRVAISGRLVVPTFRPCERKINHLRAFYR